MNGASDWERGEKFVYEEPKPTPAPAPAPQPRSVLKPWVETLGLRHQGVLMSCIRGCDAVAKDDPSKLLVRCLRAAVLNSFDPKPSSFIENVDENELLRRMTAVLKSHDHYPVHYIMHLLHGAEIVGYKWPDEGAANWWWFYRKLCQCFHVNPETEEEMDARLGACEAKFAQAASAYMPAATPAKAQAPPNALANRPVRSPYQC